MKKTSEETKNNYFCVILDLFARKAVGKKISTKNSTQLTKSTLRIAYESRKSQLPLMFHSDNGSNYRSRMDVSAAEKSNFYNKYIRKMRLEIDDKGLLRIKVQEE